MGGPAFSDRSEVDEVLDWARDRSGVQLPRSVVVLRDEVLRLRAEARMVSPRPPDEVWLLFSDRLEMEKAFFVWAEEHQAPRTPLSLITWLASLDLLRVEAVEAYLSALRKKKLRG